MARCSVSGGLATVEMRPQHRLSAGSAARSLRRRAITLRVPDILRYHAGPYHHESRSAPAPAMVAAVTGADGNQTGVHVTWLDPFGGGKARVSPARKTFGLISGGTVRLAPVADEIAIGEGIETSLAFMELTGTPAWAAMNAIGLRSLRLPASVRSVILLADNNTADDPGKAACEAAAQRLLLAGTKRVQIAVAEAGKDFNDMLIEGKR